MKIFIVKTGLFVLLLAATIFLYIFLLAKNDIDPYYYRFTTGKYKSLVLGTSRAAQGIEPAILNEILGLTDNKMFNYSFTVNRSQWGEPYRKSIKKKLDSLENNNGIFILECNLWAFCSRKDQIGIFKEEKTPPNSIANPSLDPNIQYFFGGYEHQNFRLLFNFKKLTRRNSKNRIYVNKDGRFEINVPHDSMNIFNHVIKKVILYEGMASEFIPDSARMRSFISTIGYLKKFGSVYLVRMPVAEEILEVESSLYPEFNDEMNDVSRSLQVPYFDFTYLSDKYITIDGNHLHNKYVDDFNRLLASEIIKSRTKEDY